MNERTLRALADMPEEEYQLYVQPALNAALRAQNELAALKRETTGLLGAICAKYGDERNRISVPAGALCEEGTLYRVEEPWSHEVTYAWRPTTTQETRDDTGGKR